MYVCSFQSSGWKFIILLISCVVVFVSCCCFCCYFNIKRWYWGWWCCYWCLLSNKTWDFKTMIWCHPRELKSCLYVYFFHFTYHLWLNITRQMMIYIQNNLIQWCGFWFLIWEYGICGARREIKIVAMPFDITRESKLFF